MSIDPSEEPSAEFKPSTGFSILALAPSFVDGLWRPEHFLLDAASKYVPVVWMNPPYRRDNVLWGHSRRESRGQTPSRIISYSPPRWLPHLHRPALLRRGLFRRRMSRAIDCLDTGDRSRIVLSLWRPWLLDDIDLQRFALTSYHATHLYTDWGASEEAESRLLQAAGQTFVSSRALLERCSSKTTHCAELPNGVDHALFSKAVAIPSDLGSIPAPRLIYAGVIKLHIRLGLLADIAEKLPHCSLVLVGPIGHLGEEAPNLERLKSLPNVYLLGAKRVGQLPGYLQHGDIGLLPYQVNNYTRHISPMKLHEYLSSGIPCVGSPIDPLIPFRDVVEYADDAMEWTKAIARMLEQPKRGPADVERRRRVARAHDWDVLARRYLNILAQRLKES